MIFTNPFNCQKMKITRKTLILWTLVFLTAILLMLFVNMKNSDIVVSPYALLQEELHSFEENNVKVSIYLAYDDKKLPVIAALFTPLLENYHLYGKNTPKTGVDGIGRPTLVEIKENASIIVRGEIVESTPPVIDPSPGLSLSEPLYIYPDGPVTLYLPITITATQNRTIYGAVFVSYMTCSSSGRCTPPVVEKAVNLIIPSTSSR